MEAEVESGTDGVSESEKATTEFVTGIKERDALKKELEERTREVNKVKGRNYDLMVRIEDLEKQGSKPKSPAMSKKRVAKRKVPRKGKHAGDLLSPESTNPTDDIFENTEHLYELVAERFPDLALSTVLIAEKKFIEADVDKSGTIDGQELENILDSSQMLFTKDQIKEILSSIDNDNTQSLDFFECLEAIDQVNKNRKTHLPQSLQRNRSAVCVIQ